MTVTEVERVAPEQPPRSTRRRRWPLVVGLVAVVGAWFVWCGWTIVLAHNDIQDGRALARDLQHDGYDQLIDGDDRSQLDAVRARFTAAAERLEQPGLAPLRIVPVIGRQLDSTTSLSQSVRDATTAGMVALDRLDLARGDTLPAGPGRPAALREVAQIASDLGDDLKSLDLGPDEGLIGRLSDARIELQGDIDELVATSERAEVVARGMGEVFEGPGRWLLVAANNAQMQNGSGMFLSYSVMDIEGGRITIGDVHRTEDLLPLEPVDLDTDQAALWPWMDPNGDFRHLGTSARFDATAETAADLYAAAGNEPVDGVLAVDAFALRSLLTITGPALVDGEMVTAERVVEDLLHDQYEVLVAAGPNEAAQESRRDRLGQVAKAAMDGLGRANDLESEDVDALVSAAHARHLMAWSPDPDRQAAFEAAGIDGAPPDDGLLLSVVNRGGNKLDWFLAVEATMSVRRDPAGDEVEVRARLVNQVPAGEPRYVAGPFPGSGLRSGQYLGVATLMIPGYATDLTVDGSAPVVRGPDGVHQVVGAQVLVEPGGDADVVFRFRMPAGAHELQVISAARAQLTTWSFMDPTGSPPLVFQDASPSVLRWAP